MKIDNLLAKWMSDIWIEELWQSLCTQECNNIYVVNKRGSFFVFLKMKFSNWTELKITHPPLPWKPYSLWCGCCMSLNPMVSALLYTLSSVYMENNYIMSLLIKMWDDVEWNFRPTRDITSTRPFSFLSK